MQMQIGEKAERAADLLREVITAICAYPEQLEIELRNGTAYEIAIHAHPTDSRRIVGSGGDHFRALQALAQLLFHGTGRLVTILRVTYPPGPAGPFIPFKPRMDWPIVWTKRLIKRMAEEAFPAARAAVKVIPHDDVSSLVEVAIAGDAPEREVRRFGSALHIIMKPVGSNIGRLLAVNVNYVGSETDSARGATGPGRAAVLLGREQERPGARMEGGFNSL